MTHERRSSLWCRLSRRALRRQAPRGERPRIGRGIKFVDVELLTLTVLVPGVAGVGLVRFGGKSHAYPEEVFIVSGRLYDQAFGLWLEAGPYASCPPGEVHGPFRTDTGCLVLDVSFPNCVADRA
jgi:hypothetical protein